MRQNLKKLGHQEEDVLEAGTGKEALDLIHKVEGKIDLILSDWNMPEMDGLSLVKELQKKPDLRRIPVVMVSSESDRDRIVEAIRCGARNYITKPFTPEALARKIHDVRAVDKLEEAHTKQSSASLQGILSDVGLAELTQFLHMSQMSGDLKITANSDEGSVVFRSGEIYDCVFAGSQGEDAFFKMLTVEDGRFRFEVSTAPAPRKTQRGTLQLLMDALRMKDELQGQAAGGDAG